MIRILNLGPCIQDDQFDSAKWRKLPKLLSDGSNGEIVIPKGSNIEVVYLHHRGRKYFKRTRFVFDPAYFESDSEGRPIISENFKSAISYRGNVLLEITLTRIQGATGAPHRVIDNYEHMLAWLAEKCPPAQVTEVAKSTIRVPHPCGCAEILKGGTKMTRLDKHHDLKQFQTDYLEYDKNGYLRVKSEDSKGADSGSRFDKNKI